MERWSSHLGFILATAGAAVGIGNIWRFSSLVGQNGGGAYLIPYFIAVFVFTLPLMILEIAMGRPTAVITALKVFSDSSIIGEAFLGSMSGKSTLFQFSLSGKKERFLSTPLET